MLLQFFFLIDYCPHKDKLVMHCIDGILISFLTRNEISCSKNLINKNSYLFKSI